MENPSYIALSMMTGLQRQMEVVANNMANSASPGFQADRVIFRSLVPDKAISHQVLGAESRASFVVEHGLLRDTRSGTMERTGNTLDVGIVGPGYFAVQTEDGIRYTRHGGFKLNGDSQLTTGSGAQVLSDGGTPITVPPDSGPIEIDRRGNITGKDGPIARLRIVGFENEQTLRKAGGNLLETDDDPVPVDQRTEVAQGMVEGSNVQPVREVTQMIELMRRYSSAGRLLEQDHERARRAIEKLSRVA